MQRIGAALGPVTAQMSSTSVRFLVALAAAMFFANSFAYAARACLELPSPALHDTGVCVTHCAQDFKSDRRLSQEFPGPALAPAPVVPHASLAPPPAPLLALAPQIVGPPLTILFRRFRN